MHLKLLFPEVEVTRLLSNVIKWNYVNFDANEKQVIASEDRFQEDAKAAAKQLLHEMHIVSPQEQADNFLSTDKLQEEVKEAEFVEGISAVNYDEMMEKEKERIAIETDSLLSAAKEEAEQITAAAEQEAGSIRQNAHDEGFQQGYDAGFAQGSKEAEELKQQTREEQVRLQEEYEKRMREAEPYFANIVGSLVEKITGIVMEGRKESILHLIHCGIEEAGSSRHFLIHVSREIAPFVEKKKNDLLSQMKEGTKIEIVEDASLSKNQCLIETDTKIIDSSIDVQLRTLQEDLKILSLSVS